MIVRFEPSGKRAEARAGQTILEVAREVGVDIEAVCGGRGTCGKCKVIVADGLSPLTDQEKKLISEDEIRRGYRLACQTVVLADTDVVVPDESTVSRVSILSDASGGEVELDAWVKHYTVMVPDSTLADQTPDWENVQDVLYRQYAIKPGVTLGALRELPSVLRENERNLDVVLVDDTVVRFRASDCDIPLLGIAFDIGTTTVVGYLLDLEHGNQLAVASRLNPQTRYGDDVISRIGYVSAAADGLLTLQKTILGALNEITRELLEHSGYSTNDVYASTIVCNTTMHHLLLGLDPTWLAQAPYVPVTSQMQELRASQLGLDIHPMGLVVVLPNIAGWVGADTVGVILATRLYEQDEPALAIDIGTNGEMALGTRERVVTCSTAAGPAFEGAHLSCGMRAADGAIEGVTMDDDVALRVIGGTAPRGVCGSGLVDLVAAMLQSGVLTSTGRYASAERLRQEGSIRLADRLIGSGRNLEFVLVSAEEGAGGRPVMITQRDIRELQLAKGAIRAGIEILLNELNLCHEDVRKVYLAGAFGNYIDPDSALAIGLMPHFENAQVIPVGNAAGAGARMVLLSNALRQRTPGLVNTLEYIELSAVKTFQERFAEAMTF